MKISLPQRIFLVHLAYTMVITLGVGALAVRNLQDAYDRYSAQWKEQVETFPTEQVFLPMANEAGRALLLTVDDSIPIESQEAKRKSISAGLNAILDGFPGVEGLFVLDTDFRIRYVSDPRWLDMAFTSEVDREFLARSEESRRVVTHGKEGNTETHLLLPIYDEPGKSEGDSGRLGSILLVYSADPDLMDRFPDISPPTVEDMDITLPLILFIAAVAIGGVLISALTVQPVRKLSKALSEYKARGFRGGLKADSLAKSGDMADTVRAINELGGKLEAMAQQGREREALLATLSQSLEEGMIAVGADGEPLAWNPAAIRVLCGGVDGKPPLLDSCVELDQRVDHVDGGEEEGDLRPATHERDEAAATWIAEALKRNPELAGNMDDPVAPSHSELEIALADGGHSPAKVTRVPMETRPGETGKLLLIRDLATFRKVESHLLEAGRYAVLAHLAAGLAHEIRNPLHAIGINAGVVEQYLESGWSAERVEAMSVSLASIRDETRRLTDLLNNYLGLVRPEAERELVDIGELCRRTVRLLSYTAKRSGVALSLVTGKDAEPVEGIADRLQQAILNLVLNAIQAMPDGGTITLQTLHGEKEVRLVVRDTGPGIPADLEGDLFDISVTTKTDGTGLGLPLVRHIAEAHGGTISYRSLPGQGTEFTLTLPVANRD